MDGERLLGIFTERDTVRALSQAHDAARHEIVSWMTHNPTTVAPDVDAEDALRTMLDSGFRHLPVVENGKVIGMVSMRDLAGYTKRSACRLGTLWIAASGLGRIVGVGA